tara:strand:- start:1382 stop:1942 length:561 start_codon:yes stop_codon:yes gene_type:complete
MRQVVLLSGGIDSLVCAELARKAGDLAGCVFVDYGHPAQVPEGWKAFAYCGSREVPLKVVHCFGLNLGDMGTSSGARVVPHRNAVLLSVAANQVAAMGGKALTIGANRDDEAEYEDCRIHFINGLSGLLKVPISIPLLGKTKSAVIATARALGLTQGDAWSCYGGGPQPCKVCPSCEQADSAWGSP